METNKKMRELNEEELTDIFAGKRILISYVENGIRYYEWVNI